MRKRFAVLDPESITDKESHAVGGVQVSSLNNKEKETPEPIRTLAANEDETNDKMDDVKDAKNRSNTLESNLSFVAHMRRKYSVSLFVKLFSHP